jgi:murein L,D-transpeptidase YafK
MKTVSYLVVATLGFAVQATADCSKQIASSTRASHILIDKSDRSLKVFGSDSVELCSFKVALGANPSGPKLERGDERTPEGSYVVTEKRGRGKTKFYLGFYLSYPNNVDKARAAERRVDPGGDILIHGQKQGTGWLGPLHRLADWTDGCIAVTNKEMRSMWPLVEVGTRVEIRP